MSGSSVIEACLSSRHLVVNLQSFGSIPLVGNLWSMHEAREHRRIVSMCLRERELLATKLLGSERYLANLALSRSSLLTGLTVNQLTGHQDITPISLHTPTPRVCAWTPALVSTPSDILLYRITPTQRWQIASLDVVMGFNYYQSRMCQVVAT